MHRRSTATTCGTNSRFYQRLLTDNHNCWTDCATRRGAHAGANPGLRSDADAHQHRSDAGRSARRSASSQGTIASGASRYDADTIAKYEFQTGTGNVAYDTSGIDPSADLTITGNVTWAGGWGINVGAGGKAQATTAASSKLYTLIQATGEFSVEAWVAPALVAVDKSYMVSYSGGDTTRNFTLGQTNQDYDFMLRSSNSDLNGMPQLQTPTAAMLLQASLQHVVLTYDPVNGRQIYVNGVNANVPDPQKGGTISNWDNTFALVLGNEVSGDRSWQGLIKFVAIHSRAMSAAQVLQNFNAGVGERYYMLFNVATVTGVSQAYVMFTVSQYDSYGYLFYQPTFISLDPTVKPTSIPVKGIRIGINGTIPQVGQAYIPLNTTVTAANYTPQGEVLSNIGTVIGLENGPLADQFFLQFDQLGSQTNVIVEPTPVAAALPAGTGRRRCRRAHLRTGQFDPVGAHRGSEDQRGRQYDLSGRAAAAAAGSDPREFLLGEPGRHRAARDPILQRAGQYPGVCIGGVPGVTFSGSLFPGGIGSVTGALANRLLGSGLRESAGGLDRDHRARQSDRRAVHDAGVQHHRADTGGDGSRVRDRVRQRRHVDQLSSRRMEEVQL